MLVFENSKKKVEKKVVGFESLAFKATYFIVCFGKNILVLTYSNTFFPQK